MTLSAPVVLIGFNRPDLVRESLKLLSQVKPKKLYFICDGPRKNRTEAHLVEETRRLMKDITWQCDVVSIISEENLGCRKRIVSGLDEVFKNEDRAIVIEDDCVPSLSFFQYCDQLLEKYKDDDRIGIISGNNFCPQWTPQDTSYVFSSHTLIWGWATWRRVWQTYDSNMTNLPAIIEGGLLREVFPNNELAQEKWSKELMSTYNGVIDTWDNQLAYCNWLYNRVNIIPKRNLVTNVGFRPDATHTKKNSRMSCLPHYEMDFPLVHPESLERNEALDDLHQRELYSPSFAYRVFRRSKELFFPPKDFASKVFAALQ